MKSLFTTLVVSLPAFGNVGALIGLFFYMYAYVGVMLFANVKHQVRVSRLPSSVCFPWLPVTCAL